jgi:tRNA A-37 threonylcarbamoyl transferase component Bud32
VEASIQLRQGRVDLLLGRIALARGILARDQLREALAEQAAGVARGRKVPRRLGVILVEKKFLSDAQLKQLLDEQETRLIQDSVRREEDMLLGEILVNKGWCTVAQVNEALDLQAEAIDRVEEKVPHLGDILLGKRHLKADQLRKALALQECRVLVCRICLKPWTVEKFDPSREYQCPHCRASLEVRDVSQHMPVVEDDPPPVIVEEAAIPTRKVQAVATLPSFGKYEILREVGRGAMGVVYQARDTQLDRIVALKLMLPGQHADPDEKAVDEGRFIREAQLAARLPKHPGIVGIYEAGIQEGKRYIAMEYVDGHPFSSWRRGGSVTVRLQVRVIRDVAAAVHHAHENGVLHRDLKPVNILVDEKGQACVTDFGLAKGVGKDLQGSLTSLGMIMGTPSYMSPEQARGNRKVDRRTDVWSLGVILYEAMTGRLPFRGETPMDVLMKVVEEPVVPPSRLVRTLAGNPQHRSLEKVCLAALEKDPRTRVPTARALADELTRWLKSAGAGAPPPAAAPKRWRPF